jgi:hypothetical protein
MGARVMGRGKAVAEGAAAAGAMGWVVVAVAMVEAAKDLAAEGSAAGMAAERGKGKPRHTGR